jgi:crotonobetainyl-CoA:carnitine CoA-transferase CaiB-like acyl-CoA transferase
VIKIERPGVGDDTRRWGPPFLDGPDGATEESGYYLAINRNKRSAEFDVHSLRHRDELISLISPIVAQRSKAELLAAMEPPASPEARSTR